MRKTNFEVSLASDGNIALDTIEQEEGNIDVLATDLIHGGIDAITLMSKIRKKYPQIKILICTGLQSLDPEISNIADDVLYKPFQAYELIEQIKMLMNL